MRKSLKLVPFWSVPYCFLGNGPDLVYINTKTQTIEHIEVKSTLKGDPTMPDGDPNQRFKDWINEAAKNGTINKKQDLSGPNAADG